MKKHEKDGKMRLFEKWAEQKVDFVGKKKAMMVVAMLNFNILRSIQPWSKHKFSIAFTYTKGIEMVVLTHHIAAQTAAIRSFQLQIWKHKSAKSSKKLFISLWCVCWMVGWLVGVGLLASVHRNEHQKQIRKSMVSIQTRYYFFFIFSRSLSWKYALDRCWHRQNEAKFIHKQRAESGSLLENMFYLKWKSIIKKLW